MANEITRVGYGQVEPNHLSAQRTGQVYAQLPMDGTAVVLENGTYVKYDMEAGKCNFTGDGEWMLVFNEPKLYEVGQTLSDFALKQSEGVDGTIVPRVYKTNVGDIYTTNMVKQTDALGVVGSKLVVGSAGVLELDNAATTGMIWNVVKVYTMPDGQKAVKLQRIN
jgi:hypothetical protein